MVKSNLSIQKLDHVNIDISDINEVEDERFYDHAYNISCNLDDGDDDGESCKTVDVESTECTEVDDNYDEYYHNEIYTKPIIVGYAFGPKKMSTMSVVMAEASKTKICTISTSLKSKPNQCLRTISSSTNHSNINTNTTFDNECIINNHVQNTNDQAIASTQVDTNLGLTKAILSTHEQQQDTKVQKLDGILNCEFSFDAPCLKGKRKNKKSQRHNDSIVFTIDGHLTDQVEENPTTNLRSIIRYFRSSCSSVGSEEASTETGTKTATSFASSSQYAGTATTFAANSSSNGSNSRRNLSQSNRRQSQLVPVRVSFVPLDPDVALEEQHGGKMDVILHKLTEDILCLSQLAMTRPELKQNLIERKIRSIQDTGLDLDNEDEQAVQRVLNVSNFHHMNPECHLVDDPARVLTLMSRADIADTLKYCLTNVVSASGIPVGSPAYAVISPSRDFTYDSTIVDSVVQQMDWSWLHTKVSTLSYPLIVKPLTAAGTKASHAMAVIMDPTALQKVVSEKSPCILQQYSNHDALLYKVYVLGNHVSVHKRRSVPNLPKNVSSILNYVDFDSQRPYPRLSDFGYPENVIQEDVDKDCTTQSNQKRPRPRPRPRQCENMCAGVIHDNKNIITVEEIMPIVNSLKDAFGLELFGFDVLITPVEECDNKCNNHTCDDKCRRMLVIDVNYFPSYKEVTNFPALLAKYLTDRALESRRKARRKST